MFPGYAENKTGNTPSGGTRYHRASMKKICYWLIAALIAAGMAGAGLFYWRIHAYDGLIARTAAAYAVDARLIRELIWHESHFNPRRVGARGEIGLMQVTEQAGREWAEAENEGVFEKNDLFQPDINLRAGTWYLARAINYWSQKSNPLPYALAEYNAGRSNTARWAADDHDDANRFWNNISYPTTKRYVCRILNGYRRDR